MNPTPSQWDDVFGYTAKKLDIPLVSYREWLSRLKEASTTVKNAQEHSAPRLIEFYEALDEGNGLEVGGCPCVTQGLQGVCARF